MFKVYWTIGVEEVHGRTFEDMKVALGWAQAMRGYGYTFVVMVSEDPNQVGKRGVDAVIDGKLPNGDAYNWKKDDALSRRMKE